LAVTVAAPPRPSEQAGTHPDEVAEALIEEARRRARRRRMVVGGVSLAVVVGVVVAPTVYEGSGSTRGVTAPHGTTTPPGSPLAENGLIAFARRSDDSRTDLYVVAPDGTGLRNLTSTSDKQEFAPAWSPDGTRLAFLRSDGVARELSQPSFELHGGELVIIDPSTGVETFSAEVGSLFPASPFQWSPDGRFIAVNTVNGPAGGIVDLETNTLTRIDPHRWTLGWSPDDKWLISWQRTHGPPLLVPTDLLDTSDHVVDLDVMGVRPVPLRNNLTPRGTVSWTPDGSAVAITLDVGSTDIVTIADGQRRTLIEDGVAPSWSPDGGQLAYLREPDSSCDLVGEVWIAAGDGTGAHVVATSLAAPIWSPDGAVLLGTGPDGLFTVRPDGTDKTILTRHMLRPANPDGCSEGGPTLPEATYHRPSVTGPAWQPLPPAVNSGDEA
jgi:dipeptidyl aminopeptidase/acylaminoacyl peptidase